MNHLYLFKYDHRTRSNSQINIKSHHGADSVLVFLIDFLNRNLLKLWCGGIMSQNINVARHIFQINVEYSKNGILLQFLLPI